MARFLTSLRIEEISSQGRGTWELVNALAYKSELLDYTIIVPSGFITDLASVPRIPVAFTFVGCMAHRAGVVHDWLYTSHEVDRALADKILREAAGIDGAGGIRAGLLWAGVRIGGAGPWGSAAQRQRQYDHIKQHFK